MTDDKWSTPQDFFAHLNDEFHFDIDVCATNENAKCERYFTEEQDGLKQEWIGTVWCNPPYSKGEIPKWLKKAHASRCTTVMLLPASTDTAWFHDYVLGRAEIRFVRGKLKFGGSKWTARFPSMVCIFRNGGSNEKQADS